MKKGLKLKSVVPNPVRLAAAAFIKKARKFMRHYGVFGVKVNVEMDGGVLVFRLHGELGDQALANDAIQSGFSHLQKSHFRF